MFVYTWNGAVEIRLNIVKIGQGALGTLKHDEEGNGKMERKGIKAREGVQ